MLRRTVSELFDSMPVGPVVCNFIQYSFTFFILPEVASDDIMSSLTVEEVGLDVLMGIGGIA